MSTAGPAKQVRTDHGLDAARNLLPGLELGAADLLRAGERSRVQRVHTRRADGELGTVVLKEFLSAGEGWAREAAALSVLPHGVASGVVAAGGAPPVIVTDDLGTGPSLADALLGTDPAAAADEVRRWARAVAHLHAASADARDTFTRALAHRAGDLPIEASRVRVELHDAARSLDAHSAALGVAVPSGALDELRTLGPRLDRGPSALSPCDTCPDNNVRVGERLVLIDFEAAQWRPVAWDIAYLFVPWPTCWCSWRIPDDVARSALADYRQAAAPTLPLVADAPFERDVQAAAVGWALASASWFLGAALGSDPALRTGRPAPTRRAMIQHRLGVAAGSCELPAAAELAARLGAALRARWGDVPLRLAPAFGAAG